MKRAEMSLQVGAEGSYISQEAWDLKRDSGDKTGRG